MRPEKESGCSVLVEWRRKGSRHLGGDVWGVPGSQGKQAAQGLTEAGSSCASQRGVVILPGSRLGIPFTTIPPPPHPQADTWLSGHKTSQPRVWGQGPPSTQLPGVTRGQRKPRGGGRHWTPALGDGLGGRADRGDLGARRRLRGCIGADGVFTGSLESWRVGFRETESAK